MWWRFLSMAIGGWVIASPGALGYDGAAGINDHVVGTVVAAVSYFAVWGALRPLRWTLMPVALWQAGAVVFLGSWGTAGWSEVVSGLTLVLITPAGGETWYRYGGGWLEVVRGKRTALGG